MFKIFKRVLMLTMVFVLLVPAVSCKKEQKKEKDSKTLAEKICEEAQKVADFARDQKFIYGNASINPGYNWGALDVEKAIKPEEKLTSCDRFVDWVLYRCGFIDQPYDNGYDVPKVYAWFDAMEFEKITDVSALQAGDIVFTREDPLKPGYPGHVFICASENLGGNVYLRYDHGSNERIRCVKGTEVTPGQQPFKEVIDEFYFAYRPDDRLLDVDYADGKHIENSAISNNVDISIEIPYGKAAIDGKISENEYKNTYKMDRTNCIPWQGVSGKYSSQICMSWDETGLYVAAEIEDNSPSYKNEKTDWVGVDCLQLGVNPGNLIKQTKQGIFFTFGATADGKVVASRHNYKDGLISDKIQGVSSGHTAGSDSYIIEVLIPWEEMVFESTIGGKVDTTSFEHKEGAEINILPCVIDCKEDNVTINCAYKFKDSDFFTSSYVPGKLVK